ncbi:MAG: DUF885 domain-containing protein [Myxococcota bacterium]|nr:DUF885 domain-containing protein [Myxococcota bacterium]
MSEFATLTDSYLDLRWHIDPVEATGAGLVEHDTRLGAFGATDVVEHLTALSLLSSALEECEVDGVDEEIDRTALLNDVRVTIHRFEKERPNERDPAFWAAHVLEGLYMLLTRRDRPREHRVRAIEKRLKALPGFFQTAIDTLEECPRVFVDTGIEMAEAGANLVLQIEQEFSPDGESGFDSVCMEAEKALHDFAGYLEANMLDSDEADFAIGEDAFNFRLHNEHALRINASDLWKYGQQLMEEVENELAELAEEIEPGVSWPDVVDKLRGIHPPVHQLVAAYDAEMNRCLRFVQDHDLVSIPEGDLEVVETPEFLRPIIPLAAYQPPGVFSDDRTGWFYVTPPKNDAPPATIERIMRSHCVHDLSSTALHEGYPGHHLQFLSAFSQPRIVRRVVGTPLTVEGWALYCEEMMGEAGFYSTLEERFFQRLALLWRAIRIVADVGLHTRDLPFEEAVRLLVERVHFEPEQAKAEVRRYCAHPVYQACYAVGRRELKKLREDYKKAMGGRYSVKRFHQDVLSYGGLPVSFMRWGMGLDD